MFAFTFTVYVTFWDWEIFVIENKCLVIQNKIWQLCMIRQYDQIVLGTVITFVQPMARLVAAKYAF